GEVVDRLLVAGDRIGPVDPAVVPVVDQELPAGRLRRSRARGGRQDPSGEGAQQKEVNDRPLQEEWDGGTWTEFGQHECTAWPRWSRRGASGRVSAAGVRPALARCERFVRGAAPAETGASVAACEPPSGLSCSGPPECSSRSPSSLEAGP